jgi:hypothetical protein
MHPIVCHDIANGAVCTTVILVSTNVKIIDTNVSTFVYCATVFRYVFQEVIIRYYYYYYYYYYGSTALSWTLTSFSVS